MGKRKTLTTDQAAALMAEVAGLPPRPDGLPAVEQPETTRGVLDAVAEARRQARAVQNTEDVPLTVSELAEAVETLAESLEVMTRMVLRQLNRDLERAGTAAMVEAQTAGRKVLPEWALYGYTASFQQWLCRLPQEVLDSRYLPDELTKMSGTAVKNDLTLETLSANVQHREVADRRLKDAGEQL